MTIEAAPSRYGFSSMVAEEDAEEGDDQTERAPPSPRRAP